VVITWLFIVTFGGQGNDDFFGLFLLAAAAEGRPPGYIEGAYCLLLALPIILLYYRTR
jgi:hypothetical protein